jgi:hypothetical protein
VKEARYLKSEKGGHYLKKVKEKYILNNLNTIAVQVALADYQQDSSQSNLTKCILPLLSTILYHGPIFFQLA